MFLWVWVIFGLIAPILFVILLFILQRLIDRCLNAGVPLDPVVTITKNEDRFLNAGNLVKGSLRENTTS